MIEKEGNTNLEKSSGQSDMILWALEQGVSESMNYVNDSIKHVSKLMHGLQINKSKMPTNVGQVMEVIEAHNNNAHNIQTTINCVKEIRNLIKLKLDAVETLDKISKMKR